MMSRAGFLVIAILVAAGPAHAQSPGSVPLRENTPSRGTTETRPALRNAAPDTTTSAREVPDARNRPNREVSPPSAIDTGVKVIAPERR